MRQYRASTAPVHRAGVSPHTPTDTDAAQMRPTAAGSIVPSAARAAAEGDDAPGSLGKTAQRTILRIDDIVPEALHRRVGWDIRHHFMAEKIVDRFGLQLPRDRELVRQLAVVYVLGGLKTPPAE